MLGETVCLLNGTIDLKLQEGLSHPPSLFSCSSVVVVCIFELDLGTEMGNFGPDGPKTLMGNASKKYIDGILCLKRVDLVEQLTTVGTTHNSVHN